MFNQFFGQFLLQKGLLTAEQLCCVLHDEELARVKLGVLAIDRGWMSVAQTLEINELQKIQDKRFGDLAISMGYLNSAQVEELLQSQRQRHLSISQAIIDRGYLSLSELTPVLELYKAECTSSEGFDRNVEDSMRMSVDVVDQLYVEYVGLFQRNIVRSLQVQPVLERTERFSGRAAGWFVSQKLEFDTAKLLTGMVLSDDTMIRVASLYSKESLYELDELVLDATAEFLNLHNGLFSINQSNSGIDIAMSPQKIEQSPVLSVSEGFAFSIIIPSGRLQLIVAKE